MFTGCVVEIGTVVGLSHASDAKGVTELRVQTHLSHKARLGDSIAVSGVCLTVFEIMEDVLTFHLLDSTLSDTRLRYLECGSKVNLEPSLRLGDALDGHFVLGHADTIAKVVNILQRNSVQMLVEFQLDAEWMKYLPKKASVTVDGVSLTVQNVFKNGFSTEIVPYTFEHTTLGLIRVGDMVNIEIDALARYSLKYA